MKILRKALASARSGFKITSPTNNWSLISPPVFYTPLPSLAKTPATLFSISKKEARIRVPQEFKSLVFPKKGIHG